jgi:hypothetical protein
VKCSQVEKPSHEGPTHWHICNEDGGTCFSDIPICPHRGEWMDEGVVFI